MSRRSLDDRHDYRRALAALKGLAWMIKQLKVHMTCPFVRRKLLGVATVLAVDPAIYLFDGPVISVGKP